MGCIFSSSTLSLSPPGVSEGHGVPPIPVCVLLPVLPGLVDRFYRRSRLLRRPAHFCHRILHCHGLLPRAPALSTGHAHRCRTGELLVDAACTGMAEEWEGLWKRRGQALSCCIRYIQRKQIWSKCAFVILDHLTYTSTFWPFIW